MNSRKKTVVVSLWNDLATTVGQELLDMVDQSPVVAIKSVKVGDFQGEFLPLPHPQKTEKKMKNWMLN